MKRDVTEAMRLDVLRVYKDKGPAAAAAYCAEIGLGRSYYSALAYRRGLTRKKSKPLTPEQKAEMRRIIPVDDSHDKRWQWAVDRGPVVAP